MPDDEGLRHCPTCVCGRRAPVQGHYSERTTGRGRVAPGTVAWAEHEEAWKTYGGKFGASQSAERIAERGGFGYWEITNLLGHEPTTWSAR